MAVRGGSTNDDENNTAMRIKFILVLDSRYEQFRREVYPNPYHSPQTQAPHRPPEENRDASPWRTARQVSPLCCKRLKADDRPRQSPSERQGPRPLSPPDLDPKHQ